MANTEQRARMRKHRQGTNVRRREALVGVRLTAAEFAAVKAAADRQRRSPASVLREAFFGETTE